MSHSISSVLVISVFLAIQAFAQDAPKEKTELKFSLNDDGSHYPGIVIRK